METNIYEFYKTIKSKEDFILFLSMLRKDLATHENEWENMTLHNFLDAFQRYCEDASFDKLSWKNLAILFLAAKVYE